MGRITQVRGKHYVTISDSVPTCLEFTSEEVHHYIFNKLGTNGLRASQTCIMFRDSDGIARVDFVCADKILRSEFLGRPPALPYLCDYLRMAEEISESFLKKQDDDDDTKFMLIVVEPLLVPPSGISLRHYTAKKFLHIMKANSLAPDLPKDDLHSLINKAISISKHLERNRYWNDVGSKLWLILVESRIHSLARHHKTYIKTLVSPSWKYKSRTGSARIS